MSAQGPSHLEPSYIYHSDGKCPDGATIVPWEKGKVLFQNATCPDTFALSYICGAFNEAGAVARCAEELKED